MLTAFNPFEKGHIPAGTFVSNKEADNACYKLAEQIQAENVKRGSDPDSVCVIHRHLNIHRRFGINPKTNPGALHLLQSLFKGEWRVATADEEKVCIAADEKATTDEMRRRSDRAAVVLVQKAAQSMGGNTQANDNAAELAAAQKEIEGLRKSAAEFAEMRKEIAAAQKELAELKAKATEKTEKKEPAEAKAKATEKK